MVITPDRQPYIQAITPSWYHHKVAEVSVLRLDIVHPHVSGNKWYKLMYQLDHCALQGIKKVLAFGGAYSNHLAATAAMANLAGLQSVGVVRGDFYKKLTPSLQFCKEQGMQLHFVTYAEYDRKTEPDMLADLSAQYPGAFIIPEGGANELGRRGAGEIAAIIPESYTHVAVAVGTGTTLAGIINNVPEGTQVYGYAPMKGGAYLDDVVAPWVLPEKQGSYKIFDNWHFGGFGKHTTELLAFMNEFYIEQNIPLDKVYTAKMMWGVMEQIKMGFFSNNARILCVHTGGLQGNISVANELCYGTGG